MITELIDLSDWKTKKQILQELKEHEIDMDERAWRKFVEQFNKRYCNDLSDEYIVHGTNGYKLTKDRKEIAASCQDLRKRALNMLKKVSRTNKSMAEKQQLKLDLQDLDIID